MMSDAIFWAAVSLLLVSSVHSARSSVAELESVLHYIHNRDQRAV
jgi:hypothetical protein